MLSCLQTLSKNNFIELFVHGNLLPSDATALGKEWRTILGGDPLPSDCAPLPGFKLLPPGPAAGGAAAGAGGEGEDDAALRLHGVASNADESNSAIEVHFQFGDVETRDEALLLALSQVASKAAFHRLRTELQLGYVVQCGVRSVNTCRGLSVLIQSAVANPASLEASIEDWLLRFRSETLAELTDERFDEYKESVARNLEEPPKTLHQEASGIWPEIVEGTHRWRHTLDLAGVVRSLRLEELIEIFDERVAAGGKLRRKVASHYASQADHAAAEKPNAEKSAPAGAAAQAE